MVAADCDRFAVRAAERSIDELVVRRCWAKARASSARRCQYPGSLNLAVGMERDLSSGPPHTG
jgi:ribosomal protein L40E